VSADIDLPARPAPSHGLPGLLLTFEGPEGSGKSTLIRSLAERLAAVGDPPLLLREPGGTAVGERVREILLDPALAGMSAETELLLMVASRAQLVREKVLPALAEGRIVICDRYADASVAYQGGGRRLGWAAVHRLNDFAVAGATPDRTFLCLLPPEAGRRRMAGREPDRLEKESAAFHDRVYAAYRAMADSGLSRYCVLDAALSPDAVLDAALARLREMEHELLKAI